jgi:hypothetical protein
MIWTRAASRYDQLPFYDIVTSSIWQRAVMVRAMLDMARRSGIGSAQVAFEALAKKVRPSMTWASFDAM